MPGAWDWRVEHENATGSAKSEIEILVTRSHMDSELSCLVNSSAMKVCETCLRLMWKVVCPSPIIVN